MNILHGRRGEPEITWAIMCPTSPERNTSKIGGQGIVGCRTNGGLSASRRLGKICGVGSWMPLVGDVVLPVPDFVSGPQVCKKEGLGFRV